MDSKEDLGRVTKKSVIGLGKVLHAAETFNPDQNTSKAQPVNPGTPSSDKPINGSRRDRCGQPTGRYNIDHERLRL